VAELAAHLGQASSEFVDTNEAHLDASSGAMLYSFEAFPSALPYCNGLTYAQMALIPFPGSLLRIFGIENLKTYTSSNTILAGDLYGISYATRNGSIHPTIWGDAYANFGPVGTLLGIFWGLVFGGIERLLRGRQVLGIIALPTYAGTVAVLVRGSMMHSMFYLFNASVLIATLLLLAHMRSLSMYRLIILRARPAISANVTLLRRPHLSNATNY
jgi:hypothetical protein